VSIFGVNAYVLAAVGLALIGLSGYAGYQHQRGNAALAERDSARAVAKQLKESLAESEAAQQALREAAKRLDEAVRVRDQRLIELERAKRNLNAAYAELKKQVGEADRACLDRDLPDAYVERLRIDRAGSHPNGTPAGSGNAPQPMPH
jgi:hypothetical protein